MLMLEIGKKTENITGSFAYLKYYIH